MISKGNIKTLEESKLKYILGYRMRTIAKEERKKVLSQANLRKLSNHELEYKEVEYQGNRLIVCYNAERAELDREHREDEIKRLREKIKNKTIKQLISNPSYRRFVKINNDKTASLDEEKIKEDALYDGIFVITTNTDLSCLQVVERYKDLWQIENGFRQLKDELEMGPMYHWKDRRIRAHVMICFMAFCLRTALYKKLRAYFKQEKFSFTELMSDLRALHSIGLQLKEKKAKMRTELKDGANHIFRALGMRVPNRILESEVQTVVIRQLI
jgi:transposase